mgnify:CR=1 FL=1
MGGGHNAVLDEDCDFYVGGNPFLSSKNLSGRVKGLIETEGWSLMRTGRAALVLAVILLFFIPGGPASATQVYFNGRALSSDVAPVVVDGHVLLPVRSLASAIGMSLTWEPGAGRIEIQRQDKHIVMHINSREAQLNGEPHQLRAAPQLKDDRILAPLTFLAEALELTMRWDMETAALHLSDATIVVSEILLCEEEGRTRLDVLTNTPVAYDTILLADPHRIVVDVHGAKLGVPPGEQPVAAGVARCLRVGQFGPDVVRVVVELNAPVGYEAFAREEEPGVALLLNHAVDSLSWRDTDEGGELFIVVPPTAPYEIWRLVEPDRVVIDVFHASLNAKDRTILLGGELVKQVRASQFLPNVVRVVLDVNGPVEAKAFRQEGGVAIQLGPPPPIDLELAEIEPGDEPVALIKEPDPDFPSLPGVKEVAEKTGKGLRVILDPGHGGLDPGALGPSGSKEKDVVLDISLRLRDLLAAVGCEVYMTRDEDRYVEFPERVRLAKEGKGDVFLSIHANAFRFQEACGTETFYHPDKQSSRLLAEALQTSLMKELGRTDRGVKTRRDLYVLRESSIPTALVEVAFINHPDEEKLLLDPEFRQRCAQALFEGLSHYFRERAGRSLGPVPEILPDAGENPAAAASEG